ncbi:MAG: ABC-type dipeptide/oligopeptide/nickel transport system, permease component [Paenibacillaceae bacterium]|jgi:peptide/nickel transport system permease protein|nr:ABC-type dipeptide/oligopeptide/nickel transport system, permease component [Paenibacillaceae bacterium]
MLRQALRSKQALAGLALMLLMGGMAVFASVLMPHDPNHIQVAGKFLPSSWEYPLGTDQLGRCVLSRLIYGARYSLGVAAPTLLALGALGIGAGTAAAYIGGWLERLFLIICDIFMAFPPLIIVLSLIGALGQGIGNILVAVVFSMWAWFARIVRTYAGIEKSKDYITAARIAGCSDLRIICYHIIPNIWGPFIVYMSTGVASLILMVSGFSFLGLGFPAGTAEWGAMLGEAKSVFYSHPRLVVYPGIFILLTAAGFNLFGEALRDILSPEEVSQ